MGDPSPSVSDALTEAGAVRLRSCDLGHGMSLTEWRNQDSRARYDSPSHHTVSLYLDGGQGVTREDGPISGGGPDKLCVLPAGHRSRWRIDGPLRMVHLYLAPEVLAYQAAARFDIDGRHVGLTDLTFADDPPAAGLVRGGVLPLDWSAPADRMALSSACHLLIHRLLRHYGRGAGGRVTGGLSPGARRRVVDHIDAHLDEALTLDTLAARAGLSTFHFAKMFRASFGLPPHRFVTACRVSRAKAMLTAGRHSLSHIADQCGFSSPSHLTKVFRSATGTTPMAWRSGS